VFGFFFDDKTLSYLPWSDLMTEYKFEKEKPYFQLMVPTEDTVSYSFVIRQLLLNRKHVYLTGETGTGKSVLLTNLLQ